MKSQYNLISFFLAKKGFYIFNYFDKIIFYYISYFKNYISALLKFELNQKHYIRR